MEERPPSAPDEPFIPASTRLQEITARSILLGAVLAAILAAANAYLGLFASLTVSASIPAAVISMAVLKALRKGNILENNIVQTAASAGESLAAGVIFTIPALVILGTWSEFHYWETTLIAVFGGLMGVLFTIPLRRAMIVDEPLQFPEGVATAEVLKVGNEGGSGVKYIGFAALIGALFKFGEVGLRLWGGAFQAATRAGGSVLFFGSNLSPALVAVGYIVGLNIAALVFIGGAINFLVAIPIFALNDPDFGQAENMVEYAMDVWSRHTRYIGVGAMVVGGLWALIRLRGSLVRGVRSSLEAYRSARSGSDSEVPRTERDMPFQWVAIALALSVVPLFFIFEYFIGDTAIAAGMAVIMLIAGFLFSAVAGYMAGLVGSSNNPISGVTIATVLTGSLLLLWWMGSGDPKGPASAIFIGAVVCCGAAIAGDNMQDLKAGHILGATPYKQQIMQVVGVLSAAVVMAPILTLLLKAYGMGPIDAPDGSPGLTAAQATLMASVSKGVFEGGLPWMLIYIGAAIAVLVIAVDLWLEKRQSAFRTPVLAVAVGIYLPFELSVPIFAGGLIAHFASKWFARRGQGRTEMAKAGARHGLLFAAGLITGEALVGIAMAVPIVVSGDDEILAFFGAHEGPIPGILLLGAVIFALSRIATGPGRRPA